jgi:hypothetical protein
MFRTESKGGSKYKKASVGDLDHLLHSILVRVQNNRPEIIGPNVNVAEEYSKSRSQCEEEQRRKLKTPKFLKK